MTSTESIDTVGFVERLRFRLRAEQEIVELTRDRGHEDRVRAEAAVRLAPGPWHLGELLRRRP